MLEKPSKEIFLPAIVVGTVVPTKIVGTAVPTRVVETAVPTRVAGTAYYWKSCFLNLTNYTRAEHT